MRPLDWRLVAGVAIVGLVCLLWLVVAGVLLWAVLDPGDWQTVLEALGGKGGLLLFLWAGSLVPAAAALRYLIEHYLRAPAKLAEDARLLLETDAQRLPTPRGSAENRRLAEAIGQLVTQREALRAEMDQRVRAASRQTELEKNRLAALMSELTKSVVVCNLDGRILLYNNRARLQFRRLSRLPTPAGGAELMGLGRSIYTVLDRKLVSHALENVQRRLHRGADAPSAQFVTATQSGKLLRVQMSPVRDVESDDQGARTTDTMTGFVLLIENITEDMQAHAEKNRILTNLTEDSRSALASARAAAEVLELPDIPGQLRERLLAVIREEVQGLSRRLEEAQPTAGRALRSRWPLEDMLGDDLIEAAVRRLESELELSVDVERGDRDVWLKVESFTLLQAVLHLAGRLRRHCGVSALTLRVGKQSGQGVLDLIWTPCDGANDKARLGWDDEPIQVGSETLSLTVRDVLERHGGECWIEQEIDDARHRCLFRLLLPLAAAQEELPAATFMHHESRPEYYDFDLFRTTERTLSLDDSPLTELAYTVFDTETTGLNPAEGDEIIQIGAVRIVNGKVLSQEFFDQLVDPKRVIPPASIPIHGITPDMVKGQPTIETVLPAFHGFCADTVLVAHNAAFDMRCLQVKEKSTGVRFDHPVLDTLLLSALVHENQDSHRLEAIAERFGLTIIGRHTAIGDAMVTAEILVKLIPLLAEKGIHTLGQARAAAQKTYYARVNY
ncbi:PAS domain-containing protein [Wenzhouxiangella sp. XN24]|uniref:3'-5' exonuclease n=1 Tax=Wenzhouxiangella sp. XN24 TaxID=2713569 RepID=UPI0013EBBFB5|nr:PAS domain-containing protein [Wenzhouxiangella sp. XN24]NGX17719.1 DNA polymerase III subunit epsilon [Wenzhouxiangella sp. XN24]